MLSYHNDPKIKAKYIKRFEAHRKADEVIQGKGFTPDGKGCFIGCTLNNYDHEQFEKELGWPVWLAHLADKIFEGIPEDEAPQFGTDLLAAVPVGVDLEPVKHLIAIKRMERLKLSVPESKEPYYNEVMQAIDDVIAYHREPHDEAARSAARSASESAARSASESAAWSAAAWSAAWSAAESAAWRIERDTLLTTIKSLTPSVHGNT